MRFVTVGLSCVQGEMEGKCAATSRLAVDAHEAVMAAHHVVHNRESEAGALWPRTGIGLNPVELPEDFTLESRRHADAAVAHSHDAVVADPIDLDADLAVLRRILHRVGDEIFE